MKSSSRSSMRLAFYTASACLVAGGAWVFRATNREHFRPTVVYNPEGHPRAALVFQPGISTFPDRVAKAFAEGLSQSGWRVEVLTATAAAPGDLSSFQLVVLLSPVYWWSPSPPMQRYLQRMNQLRNKRTIILLTASGSSDRAMRQMTQEIHRLQGNVVKALSLYRWRPNDENDSVTPNEEVAVRIAHRSAAEIKPDP